MALPISFTTHINELPAEMIDHIMRYLPLADRKSASLVCKRWEEQVFTHNFLANIQLKLYDHSDLHLVVEVLQKSWRNHRNVTVGYGIVVALILVVLEKFGKSIEMFSCDTLFRPRQLKEVLNRLPNSRRLEVNVFYDIVPGMTPQEFPVLNHLVYLKTTEAFFDILGMDAYLMMPSLRNLSLSFDKYATENICMALSSISARLTMLEVFFDLRWSPHRLIDLRQLETFELRGSTFISRNEALRLLFVNVPMLRVLNLHVPMSTSLFEVICKNCPQLTSLGFTGDPMNDTSLSALSKLTNLEILLIDGYLTYQMIDGCKPLPKVKTFYLYWSAEFHVEERFAKQLHYMLPNVTIFHLLGDTIKEMDHEFLHCFVRMFTNIKELTVAEFEFLDLHSEDIFNWIGDLINVEQLTLRCIPLKKFGCQRGSKNVKKVRLQYLDQLVGTSLLQISDIFPSLRLLEIVRCELITAQDVEMFHQKMPHCAINFFEQNK